MVAGALNLNNCATAHLLHYCHGFIIDYWGIDLINLASFLSGKPPTATQLYTNIEFGFGHLDASYRVPHVTEGQGRRADTAYASTLSTFVGKCRS